MSATDRPQTLDPGEGLTESSVRLADGRRIRTVVAGGGTGPLVAFEAGMTASAWEWLVVQRAVSAHARTLAYDRSGYAGSDDDPQPRTLERMADDLGGVLDAVGETCPVILVAHSWGAPIVRAFAHHHPARVAGVVLVDGSLAAITAVRKQVVLGGISFRITALLARLGVRRALVRLVLPRGFAPEYLPDDIAVTVRDYVSPRAMRTGLREMEEVLAVRPALEVWEREGLPDVPVVALQGGRIENGEAPRAFREEFNREAERVLAGNPADG
ncbi:alpha/beta hydrolase [Microbacterium sp. KUDC0406]|uniref:alpha/beta fold hydrolase n=1 Tax=Microbacterium sp. KUDC0406 TaxID=2909588 RepID=UPI001F41A3C8|nr:alpha/beta hydrolase [Microbacterium sp. KUDC0406]UJP10852.1 alpha/beta hydrolase [Microbacterium sp. KUDC0406]